MTLSALLLLAAQAFAACPSGRMAVGDDSDEGYRCVPRTAPARPALKPSGFKTGNDAAAQKSFGAAGATDKQGDQPADAGKGAPATEPVGAEKRELGSGLKVPKKKTRNRGDAAAPSAGCPKGWIKKGEGCAPPKKP